MARISVFGLGQRSKSPYVTSKQLINIYAEERPQGEKSTMVGYGRFGRDLFHSFGATPPRGGWWIESGSLAYVVHRSVLYSLNNAGAVVALGNLATTTGRVSITDNGKQLMVVDGTAGYIYSTVPITATPQTISSITISGDSTVITVTTATPHGLVTGNIVALAGQVPTAYIGNYTVSVTSPTTFTALTDQTIVAPASTVGTYTILAFAKITSPSFPAFPQTCCYLAGVFLVQSFNTNTFFASAPFDGLNGYALNFATAENAPDPMVAIWPSNGQAFLLCAAHSEFWGVSGGADFLFSEVNGTGSEWGVAATWSVARYGNTIACLMRNRTNQVMVATITGYLPQKMSTPDMDKIINGYSDVTDASAYSFMLGGHPMYVISFPSAGATWMYDSSTKIWSQLKSFGISRDLGEFAFAFLGNTIVSDFSTGNLYKLNPDGVTDNGDPIEITLVSETVADPDLNRLTVNRFRVDVEVGQGATSGQGANPQLGLRVSRDNGNTWGAQMMRTMGKIGEFRRTVDWDCLGTARNFVFEISMTDPVPFCIVSASVNPTD